MSQKSQKDRQATKGHEEQQEQQEQQKDGERAGVGCDRNLCQVGSPT